MTAKEVARYLIARHCSKGDVITNKQLQKLLYYVQAWALVYMEPMFDDDIEAWVHGPVVDSVYQEYKRFGYNAIPVTKKDCEDVAIAKEVGLKKKQIELIDSVLLHYGGMSSFHLEMLTHSEYPWLEARKGLTPTEPCTEVISIKTMKHFYKKRVNGKK